MNPTPGLPWWAHIPPPTPVSPGSESAWSTDVALGLFVGFVTVIVGLATYFIVEANRRG